MDEIKTNATLDERVAKGQQIRMKEVKKNYSQCIQHSTANFIVCQEL